MEERLPRREEKLSRRDVEFVLMLFESMFDVTFCLQTAERFTLTPREEKLSPRDEKLEPREEKLEPSFVELVRVLFMSMFDVSFVCKQPNFL